MLVIEITTALIIFDLYLGRKNYRHKVNISDAGAGDWLDIIVVSHVYYREAWLVNKGSGTPFIS